MGRNINTRVEPFRMLDDKFMQALLNGEIKYILQFERKNRKSFMVELRNNFVDLYFLGHTVEVKRRKEGYYFTASNEFNPKKSLQDNLSKLIEPYTTGKWQLAAKKIKTYQQFEKIMTEVISRIVAHKKGNISEGVSELNHSMDNRFIGKNGILVVDRQIVYPGNKGSRMDLLGLKRLNKNNNLFTFVILELKNKNNVGIGQVCSQTTRYIDLVYDNKEIYERFRATYQKIIDQKKKLRLLKSIDCQIAPWEKVSKKDILGLVVLDNFNVKGDLKKNGLLERAIKDWGCAGDNYNIKLFLKTNVFDSTFFMNKTSAERLLKKYKTCNS